MQPTLAFVTGTSRGIGHAVATALLARGVEVVGISRTAPDISNDRYTHFACDLSDSKAVEQLFESTIPATISLDRERIALVNNAGRLDVETIAEATLGGLIETMTINVAIPVYLHGWLLRHAPVPAKLRIIDLSSGAAFSPYPGWSAYCSSKVALDMAGQVLALENEEVPALQGRDLALVSYAPNVVATDMQKQIRSASEASFPRRERFMQLHENDELIDASGPADEIATIVDADDLPRFSRQRFQPE